MTAKGRFGALFAVLIGDVVSEQVGSVNEFVFNLWKRRLPHAILIAASHPTTAGFYAGFLHILSA